MKHEISPPTRTGTLLRVLLTLAALVLLPPFLMLAIAPMLLLLVPVAIVGIPIICVTMGRVSLAVHSDEQKRAQRARAITPRALPTPPVIVR